MDRDTKQEISSWSNDKAGSADDNLSDLSKSNGNGDRKGTQNTVHLDNAKDVFSHFQTLALQQRTTNRDIEVMKTALKQAQKDIAEGKDTFAEFQLNQKELRNNLEEQTLCLVSLEGQFRMRGNGNHGKLVDKNILGRLEGLEKLLEEKSKVIQQQSQQISDLMHTVDSLRSKGFGPKSAFRGNRAAASYVAASYEEGRVEGRVEQLEKRFEELAKQTTALKCHAQELEMQLQASLASTHNGSFLWRIPEVARRKRDAIEERITSIYSPPFYTGR